MKPVRIVETAWVVFPKTRTSWRDQTTSYMSPAAPDRMKIARTSRGWRIRASFARRLARCGPVASAALRLLNLEGARRLARRRGDRGRHVFPFRQQAESEQRHRKRSGPQDRTRECAS